MKRLCQRISSQFTKKAEKIRLLFSGLYFSNFIHGVCGGVWVCTHKDTCVCMCVCSEMNQFKQEGSRDWTQAVRSNEKQLLHFSVSSTFSLMVALEGRMFLCLDFWKRSWCSYHLPHGRVRNERLKRWSCTGSFASEADSRVLTLGHPVLQPSKIQSPGLSIPGHGASSNVKQKRGMWCRTHRVGVVLITMHIKNLTLGYLKKPMNDDIAPTSGKKKALSGWLPWDRRRSRFQVTSDGSRLKGPFVSEGIQQVLWQLLASSGSWQSQKLPRYQGEPCRGQQRLCWVKILCLENSSFRRIW